MNRGYRLLGDDYRLPERTVATATDFGGCKGYEAWFGGNTPGCFRQLVYLAFAVDFT